MSLQHFLLLIQHKLSSNSTKFRFHPEIRYRLTPWLPSSCKGSTLLKKSVFFVRKNNINFWHCYFIIILFYWLWIGASGSSSTPDPKNSKFTASDDGEYPLVNIPEMNSCSGLKLCAVLAGWHFHWLVNSLSALSILGMK